MTLDDYYSKILNVRTFIEVKTVRLIGASTYVCMYFTDKWHWQCSYTLLNVFSGSEDFKLIK